MVKRPPSFFSGFSSTSQPLLRTEEKKQLYTGVCKITRSPGPQRAFTTTDTAGTTPEVYMIHSRLTAQPWRRENQSATAS